MTSTTPNVIRASDIRERVETADGRFKLGIAIDEASHGSLLWFGFGRIKPGAESVSWETSTETHEAYYVGAGTLKIGWSGPNVGDSLVCAGDCFYFAPNHRYTLENVGDDEAFFVYGWTPAPSGSTS